MRMFIKLHAYRVYIHTLIPSVWKCVIHYAKQRAPLINHVSPFSGTCTHLSDNRQTLRQSTKISYNVPAIWLMSKHCCTCTMWEMFHHHGTNLSEQHTDFCLRWPHIEHMQTVQPFVHPAAGQLLLLHSRQAWAKLYTQIMSWIHAVCEHCSYGPYLQWVQIIVHKLISTVCEQLPCLY